MIAIPLQSAHATTLSPAFEDASFFAALDPIDGYFNIIEGIKSSTLEERIRALKAKGIDAAVLPDATSEPLELFRKEGISLYTAPESISSIDDVFEALTRSELPPLG